LRLWLLRMCDWHGLPWGLITLSNLVLHVRAAADADTTMYKDADVASSNKVPNESWCRHQCIRAQVRSPAAGPSTIRTTADVDTIVQRCKCGVQQQSCALLRTLHDRKASAWNGGGRPPYYTVCCSHTFFPHCIRLSLTRPPTPLCRCRLGGKGGFEAAL